MQAAPARVQRSGAFDLDHEILFEIPAEHDVREPYLIVHIALGPVEHAHKKIFEDGLGDLLAFAAVP